MNINWKNPLQNLTINPQEVHIWKKNLEQPSINVQNGFQMLNEAERNKAQRFRFEKHQKRFTIARSSLKHILSLYLSISPQEIEFEYNDYGKPQLLEQINNINLQFNVSHSENIAIYGITCRYLIGVDVEYIRPMLEADNLAKRFFSEKEFEYIRELSPEEKDKGFFRLWTAKEAYLKAIGQGISGGLDKVEISIDEPIRFIKLSESDHINYKLFYLTPHDNYLGAIAVQNNQQIYHYWELD
ncbi:MAG: 4'-phosphopantetheinyl transferase superfamily protein [Crocosphaera sp.]|nr:4'-phosphopantetheinyl transferase superfamily protein [Crocosphaera sp.]